MNFICVPVRNNFALTRRAIATFERQDIGDIQIVVINNHSTDGTSEWLRTKKNIVTITPLEPLSVAASWNLMLNDLVFSSGAEYALVVNNDVELRPDTYRLLIKDGGGFVTAVGKRANPTLDMPNPNAKRPHPDFSCYLIRKDVYQRVGPFDENFKVAFCEDGDYDLRMWKAGIRAYCIDLPFLHHGSMTIKNADPEETERIAKQADVNRRYFTSKWGFAMGSKEYYSALAKGEPVEAIADYQTGAVQAIQDVSGSSSPLSIAPSDAAVYTQGPVYREP